MFSFSIRMNLNSLNKANGFNWVGLSEYEVFDSFMDYPYGIFLFFSFLLYFVSGH